MRRLLGVIPSVEVSLVKRGKKINRGPLGGGLDEELTDMLVYAAHSGRLHDLDHLLVQYKVSITGFRPPTRAKI